VEEAGHPAYLGACPQLHLESQEVASLTEATQEAVEVALQEACLGASEGGHQKASQGASQGASQADALVGPQEASRGVPLHGLPEEACLAASQEDHLLHGHLLE